MPKKDDIWKDIPSTEKIKSKTPSKRVNDYTKVTNRYNADRYEIFEDGHYDSDDIDDFIDDEESDEESDETPHPSRIQGYRRRLLPKNSDSDSEESDSCQLLERDSADEGSLSRGSSKVTEGNSSRSNSPLSGLKLKRTKYKCNVIESSESDTNVEENDNENRSPDESSHNLIATVKSDNSPSSSMALVEKQSSSKVKAVEHADSGAEEVITVSDEELSVHCASVENAQDSVVIYNESSETESSSGCESEAESGSGSETEEELQKHDRAYRQRQEKLKKFEEFKERRKQKKVVK